MTTQPLPLHRLAGLLRLPADWLREEALAGRIPCLRIGNRLLFSADAVRHALAERAATSRIEPKTVHVEVSG